MQIVLMDLPPSHHQTFLHESPDGTLRAWDVTRGNEMAQDGRPVQTFSLVEQGVVREMIARIYIDINQTYAMTTDLTRPMLFVPFEGKMLLLDGHHRAWKAVCLDLAELPMVLLTPEEADDILWLELPTGHGLDWC